MVNATMHTQEGSRGEGGGARSSFIYALGGYQTVLAMSPTVACVMNLYLFYQQEKIDGIRPAIAWVSD